MNVIGKRIAEAADDVARQVVECVQGLRANLDPAEVVYAYALVVPDDFSSLSAYANTARHLAATAGRPLDKWYFAQWFVEGMGLRTEILEAALGDPTFQEDEALQNGRQASWIVALSKGLQEARRRGGLDWRGQPIAAFCSMIDSSNAVWVERETARVANPIDLLATFEAELAAAAANWYGTTDPGPRPLRLAFERAMQAS